MTAMERMRNWSTGEKLGREELFQASQPYFQEDKTKARTTKYTTIAHAELHLYFALLTT
jgi:hypothetical protein